MTTLEKLARTLCDVERKANGWPALRPDETLESAGTKWYTEMAHACLAALLEPSEAMVEAGFYAEGIDWQTDGAGRPTTSLHVWQAMIRAALKEK